MSAYMIFYLRDKDNSGRFLEMEWFCRSAWVYQALAPEVKYETYCELDEKIARNAMGWLGDLIEATEGNIADEKELIEVIKEISAPISEITEEIRYYQTVIDEHYQAIREMRAAKEIIAHYRAIAEHSENARVYVAHECNPNGDEE